MAMRLEVELEGRRPETVPKRRDATEKERSVPRKGRGCVADVSTAPVWLEAGVVQSLFELIFMQKASRERRCA